MYSVVLHTKGRATLWSGTQRQQVKVRPTQLRDRKSSWVYAPTALPHDSVVPAIVHVFAWWYLH
jgi:hypothetical protein